jgi:F1F0 ATPase subunit 2
MSELPQGLHLLGAAAVGGGLGGGYFGALWWTTRRALASARPALWVAGSALVRTAVVVSVLFALFGHDWQALVSALAGFTVARWAFTRRAGDAGVPGAQRQGRHRCT